MIGLEFVNRLYYPDQAPEPSLPYWPRRPKCLNKSPMAYFHAAQLVHLAFDHTRL